MNYRGKHKKFQLGGPNIDPKVVEQMNKYMSGNNGDIQSRFAPDTRIAIANDPVKIKELKKENTKKNYQNLRRVPNLKLYGDKELQMLADKPKDQWPEHVRNSLDNLESDEQRVMMHPDFDRNRPVSEQMELNRDNSLRTRVLRGRNTFMNSSGIPIVSDIAKMVAAPGSSFANMTMDAENQYVKPGLGQGLLNLGMDVLNVAPTEAGALANRGYQATSKAVNTLRNAELPFTVIPNKQQMINIKDRLLPGNKFNPINTQEREILHTVRNIGASYRGGVSNPDVLQKILDKSKNLSDETFEKVIGSKKAEIQSRLDTLRARATKKVREQNNANFHLEQNIGLIQRDIDGQVDNMLAREDAQIDEVNPGNQLPDIPEVIHIDMIDELFGRNGANAIDDALVNTNRANTINNVIANDISLDRRFGRGLPTSTYREIGEALQRGYSTLDIHDGLRMMYPERYDYNGTLLSSFNPSSKYGRFRDKPNLIESAVNKFFPNKNMQQSSFPITESLLPSLHAGTDVNPAAKILEAYKKVKSSEKGKSFISAHSLSSDSYPLSLSMMNKAVKEGVGDINFHGYNELNSMGFATAANLPNDLPFREINTLISDLNKGLLKKIPLAKKEGNTIYYPNLTITRKKLGGNMNYRPQKMQTGGKPDQRDYPDYDSWAAAMDNWTRSLPNIHRIPPIVNQEPIIGLLEQSNNQLTPDSPPALSMTNIAPVPINPDKPDLLATMQIGNRLGETGQENNSGSAVNTPKPKEDPYSTLMKIGLGVRAGTLGLGLLSGAVARGRQNQYDYKQQTALGMMNPMSSGDFQPTPYRPYAQMGGNPFAYYSQYGGNLKKLIKEFSNKAQMDMGDGQLDDQGMMAKGGTYNLPDEYAHDMLRELLHMGRMGHQNFGKGTKPMRGKMQGGGDISSLVPNKSRIKEQYLLNEQEKRKAELAKYAGREVVQATPTLTPYEQKLHDVQRLQRNAEFVLHNSDYTMNQFGDLGKSDKYYFNQSPTGKMVNRIPHVLKGMLDASIVADAPGLLYKGLKYGIGKLGQGASKVGIDELGMFTKQGDKQIYELNNGFGDLNNTPTFIPTAKPKPYISSKLRTDANMDLVDGKHLDQEIVGPWARTTNWKEFGDEMRGLMKRENLNPTSEADVEKFRKLWIESQNHWFMNNTKPFDKEVTLLNHVLHGSNKYGGKIMKKGGLTPNKAREILHDGTAQGHPLTDKQRRYFGAMSKGNTMNYRGHKK